MNIYKLYITRCEWASTSYLLSLTYFLVLAKKIPYSTLIYMSQLSFHTVVMYVDEHKQAYIGYTRCEYKV